ncbi:putative signal transducing protein [Dendrosporobacter sp. 1207_IL3150]|uniref:putative signal transducing protein n=1 Tax=Dendrosporobacter sp. 1207_IL3150 TaxID=3084054 RepID=UPI002FD9663A
MWTVIYIASNRAQAEMLKNMLCSEGILANTRPAGVASALGDGLYEILVLESEADEAHAILCQNAIK